MFKKPAAILMTMIIGCSCLAGNVYAADEDYGVSVTSMYEIMSSSDLTITGTTAKCVSKASAITSVTSIVVNQTLQKKTSTGSWQTVTHWNDTITGSIGSATNYKYSLASGTYRLKSQFTFLTSEGYETVVAYSTEKTA